MIQQKTENEDTERHSERVFTGFAMFQQVLRRERVDERLESLAIEHEIPTHPMSNEFIVVQLILLRKIFIFCDDLQQRNQL